MSKDREIKASVGVGPFRILFGFTLADILTGLLIGVGWLMFLVCAGKIMGEPDTGPDHTVTTPASPPRR